MSESYYKSFSSAEQLPDCWDAIAGDNIFLRKRQLEILERTNPCGQTYTVFCCPEPDSILVTYRLKLDIFTYSLISLKLPVVIAGIPCSVSECGYVAGKRTEAQLFEYLRNIKGPKLVLNSEDNFKAKGFSRGLTLPGCRMEIGWNSFEEYTSDMRSHYRYRINKAIRKFSGISQVTLRDNSLFDEKLYSLYTSVYDRSEYKLEKLSIDFFREFPAVIIAFYVGNKPVAFVQLLENSKELIFLFGGIDYSLNNKHDIYANMLLAIVKHGIQGGFAALELGQTAEDAKMKLGGKLLTKYMYINHSNKLINFLAQRAAELLSYSPKSLSFNVFKEAGK